MTCFYPIGIPLVLITSLATVSHGSEVAYVFGQVPPAAGAASRNLSSAMMDYWISFTVSLDPNDGKGAEREFPSSLFIV
jgi:carboxylesterase type B